jgi:hypothetical protein
VEAREHELDLVALGRDVALDELALCAGLDHDLACVVDELRDALIGVVGHDPLEMRLAFEDLAALGWASGDTIEDGARGLEETLVGLHALRGCARGARVSGAEAHLELRARITRAQIERALSRARRVARIVGERRAGRSLLRDDGLSRRREQLPGLGQVG